MLGIIMTILAGIGWIICFEAGWQRLRQRGYTGLNKGIACRIWWGLLGFLSLMSGLIIWLVYLMLLVGFGLSHIQLAGMKDGIITVAEMLRNIGPALNDASARIKPYLK